MLSSLAGAPGACHGQPSALPNKHDSRQGCDRLKSKGQFVAETMIHLSSKPLNSGHGRFLRDVHEALGESLDGLVVSSKACAEHRRAVKVHFLDKGGLGCESGHCS